MPLPKRSAMSARPRICAAVEPPDRQHDADIVKARAASGGWTPIWPCFAPARAARTASSGRRAGVNPSSVLDRRHEFLDAPASSTYLSRALLRSVRSPCAMKTRTTATATGTHSCGRQQHAGVAGEIAVAGDAAELHAEIDARATPAPAADRDRGKADIVGVLQHADPAAAVEGDVELARQAVQLAVIEDVVMQRARERPRVDQLLRIDAGGRAAGDVADIVGAGAARGEAEILQRRQHVEHALRRRSRGSADWRASSHRHSRRRNARRYRRCREADARSRMPLGMRSRHMKAFCAGAT